MNKDNEIISIDEIVNMSGKNRVLEEMTKPVTYGANPTLTVDEIMRTRSFTLEDLGVGVKREANLIEQVAIGVGDAATEIGLFDEMVKVGTGRIFATPETTRKEAMSKISTIPVDFPLGNINYTRIGEEPSVQPELPQTKLTQDQIDELHNVNNTWGARLMRSAKKNIDRERLVRELSLSHITPDDRQSVVSQASAAISQGVFQAALAAIPYVGQVASASYMGASTFGSYTDKSLEQYREKTGDIDLKKFGYNRTDEESVNDVLAGLGYAAISSILEYKLGTERLIWQGAEKLGIRGTAGAISKIGLQEGIEEGLQQAVEYPMRWLAGTNDATVQEMAQEIITSAVFGAIAGGVVGGGTFRIQKGRLSQLYADQIKEQVAKNPKLQSLYPNDKAIHSAASQAAEQAITDAYTGVADEITTVNELQNTFGDSFDYLVGKVESTLINAGWQEKFPERDVHEYATINAQRLASDVLRQSRLRGVPTSAVLELSEIESVDNILYLRTPNLGNNDAVAQSIADKKAEAKELRRLAKIGGGNPARVRELNAQIVILQALLNRRNGVEIQERSRRVAKQAKADQAVIQSVAPATAEELTTIQDATGDDTFVYVGNKRLPVVYEVRELSDVIPSHISGTPNQAYQLKALQNREARSTQADVAVLRERAGNLHPEELLYAPNTQFGAPIINERAEIIAGNGRYEVLRTAYQENLSKKSIDKYKKSLKKLGFDVDSFKMPVLVRVTSGLTEAQQIAVADASNVSVTSEFDHASRAKQDAKLLIGTTDMMEFADKIPLTDRQGLFLNNGKWDMVALERRYNDAIMMWLCGNDAAVFEDLVLGGGITNKIIQGLVARGSLLHGFDAQYPQVGLREDIERALRKAPSVKSKVHFANIVAQVEMDGRNVFPENAFLHSFVYAKTANQISEFIDTYTEKSANNIKASETGLFGESAPQFTKYDLLAQTMRESVINQGKFKEDGSTEDGALQAVFLSSQDQFAGQEGTTQLFHTSFDIADENARLDDIYPAYDGETIEVDGKERTVYNSNGERIAKSAEALRNFWNWFGDSKVVDEDGRPLVVYHGSTKKFEIFDINKSSKESNLGAGFYFTNNIDDLTSNYEGGGADFDNRIDRIAGRIEQEEGVSWEEAKEKAYNQEFEGEFRYATYLKLEKPFIIGGTNETVLTYEEKYNEETDEYEEPTGSLIEFAYRFDNELADLGIDDYTFSSTLFERAMNNGGYITATEIDELLSGDEQLGDMLIDYAEESVGQLLSDVVGYEYDGFIDNTVDKKFGSHRVAGQKMEGVDESTTHYIAFEPNQIKSTQNRGTFSPDTGNIYYQGVSANGFYDSELKTIVLGRNFNLGTLPHELAHFWLDELFLNYKLISSTSGASPEWVQEVETLFAFLGVDKTEDALTREQHEKFATTMEAVVFGLAKAPDGMQLPITDYMNWIPQKYKSIRAIGYRDKNGIIRNPLLDENGASFFNAWFANSSLPALESSPARDEATNPVNQSGEIVPSVPQVIKERTKQVDNAIKDQAKADEELRESTVEELSVEAKSAINAEYTKYDEIPALKLETLPKDKGWFRQGKRHIREEMAEKARKYVKKNIEHAREVALIGKPALNDTGVDLESLILAVMEHDKVDAKSDLGLTYTHNIAMTRSEAGTTLGLHAQEGSYQTYLDAYRRMKSAMTETAAYKYAGRGVDSVNKLESDIKALCAKYADAVDNGSMTQERALKALVAEASLKFAGEEDSTIILNQIDINLAGKTRDAFVVYAERLVRKDIAKTEPNVKMQNKLLDLAPAVQQASIDVNSKNPAVACAAAEKLREWYDFISSVDVSQTMLSGAINSYAPRAMLYGLSTHTTNVFSNTIEQTMLRPAIAAHYGKNVIPQSEIDAEKARIQAVYDSTFMNLTTMITPTDPSLIHGEKYKPLDPKAEGLQKLYDLPMRWLSAEDNLFRIPTYLDVASRMASRDANGDVKKAIELFNQYTSTQPKKIDGVDNPLYAKRQELITMAAFSTFTQNGKLSGALTKMRNSLNGLSVAGYELQLGTIIAPFVKTPANIIASGLRSPFGAGVALYKKAVGKELTFQDAADTAHFIGLALLALLAGAFCDYEEPYKGGKYNPNKPYDSIGIGGYWLKLNALGVLEAPMRIWLSAYNNGKVEILETISTVPFIGELVDNRLSYATNAPVSWFAGTLYNQANKLIPTIVKQIAKPVIKSTGLETDLESIDLGVKTGIGRKIERTWGLDGIDPTINDWLGIVFNRLKVQ